MYNKQKRKRGGFMFAEFLKKDKFYEKYMQVLLTRMAIGNVEMENPDIQGTMSERYFDIFNNIEAFRQLVEENKDKITPYDIADVAYRVNNGEYNRGFRKTQVEVRKAKNFYPIEACYVVPKMYSLMDNYYNVWNMLPVYEKEAKLHIELVRTQPFEDGNKRTARILTNYNLCKQNKAPVIINGIETDKYFDYIDDYDVDGFAEFLKTKSKKELEVMMDLYKTICKSDSFVEDEEKSNSFVYVYKKQFSKE